jgi:serine/threonine protein kinase
MTLQAGSRLGTHEILSAIGAGGMGEVYRARDTKLNRDVAIKVLLPAVANDPDRLARFSREAQVLASLNHPNIAQIHGLEESNGVTALVMELVEGEDLSQRIARGPIPIDEALPIARQIAEALEAAHDHGIIHRDLKPANIKLRSDGTVKVLDFGLAKAVDPAAGSSATAMNSPTLSIHATEAGIILGTAAYMSPEQARGKAVDRRADIWAFGTVLFEMLTAKRAFAGDDATDTIVAVVSKDPDWGGLPTTVPAGIRTLLRRSLEKDPKRRLDSAAGLRIEIDDALHPINRAGTVPNSPRQQVGSRLLPWGIALVALVAGVSVAWRAQERAPLSPVYASLDAPMGTVLGEDDNLASLPTRTPMVFTPDGKSLIIQAARDGKPQLYIRSLDRPDARPIAGTDDARVPFVSPDGKWIGFWAANELRKVPIDGGAPTVICPLRAQLGPYGATWGVGDVIVFGDEVSGGLMRVSAHGGSPAPVTVAPSPESNRLHVAPFFLPDGKRVLFSEVHQADATDARLMVQALDGSDPRLVMASATDGRLLPTGELAFMRLGTLMTAPFDLLTAEVSREAASAVSGVMQSGVRGRAGADHTGAGMFTVSSLGALAMLRGPLTGPDANPLIWVTRDGQASVAEPSTGAPAGGRFWIRISPDRSRAVVAVMTPIRLEVWLVDWTRSVWTPCRDCAANIGPAAWSPDSRSLLLGRGDTLVVHGLDESVADQVMIREPGRALIPILWMKDGRILYQSTPDQASYEIKVLDPGATAGRVVVPLGMGTDADVSPDGRWLAYTVGQQNQRNVMVQAFPGPGARAQVSVGGGRNAAWSVDGRTLYYLTLGGPGTGVVAVDMDLAGEIKAGPPRQLFQRPDGQGCANSRCYDISAGDSRLLLRDRTTAKRETVARMDLVLNWTATLTRKH